MNVSNLANADHPNAGRIYDYLLGGNHNFEVDRQAAERIVQAMPFVSKAMRLQRWCLQDLAEELTQNRGFDIIIDFASGLPTQEHFHHIVPSGTTVIYSDYDPISVAYAQEILAGSTNIYYFQADARKPEELLNHPEVLRILNGRHDVALIYWGIAGFLPDSDLSYIAQYLYEWSDDASCFVFNAQGANINPSHPMSLKVSEIYQKMGTPLYPRPLEKYMELLQPWKPQGDGFIPLLEWHGLDLDQMSGEDKRAWGISGGGFGTYLSK